MSEVDEMRSDSLLPRNTDAEIEFDLLRRRLKTRIFGVRLKAAATTP